MVTKRSFCLVGIDLKFTSKDTFKKKINANFNNYSINDN